jgi:hypothetical protein
MISSKRAGRVTTTCCHSGDGRSQSERLTKWVIWAQCALVALTNFNSPSPHCYKQTVSKYIFRGRLQSKQYSEVNVKPQLCQGHASNQSRHVDQPTGIGMPKQFLTITTRLWMCPTICAINRKSCYNTSFKVHVHQCFYYSGTLLDSQTSYLVTGVTEY